MVNEANSELNETFTITPKRSEEEEFIVPGDSGVFDINIDSNGSVGDVLITITVERTNLPDNLKFYLDAEHTNELTTHGVLIKKTGDMTKTVPVYWYWNGRGSDENDNLFINTTINADITVTATIANNSLYDELLKQGATLDTNVDFGADSSETNGQGLMMVNTTQNDEYPILYYRGDVTNNNVIYAGYCWLIVRTTETGGVKLIYNGEVNGDGSCNNYSGVGGKTQNTVLDTPYLQETVFNLKSDSPVYAGYMYNDSNAYFTHSSNWTSGEDMSGVLDAEGYKSHLADYTIDSQTGRHVQNLKDSNIKSVIDTWYEENIKDTDAEDLLEDTVWCANRSLTSVDAALEGNNYTFSVDSYNGSPLPMFLYEAGTKILMPTVNPDFTITMNLNCSRDIDKFTVNTANGNGDLDYPIGLLTVDEILMTGVNYLLMSNSYIGFYLLSPAGFQMGNAAVGEVYYDLVNLRFVAETGSAARPSVSLRTDAYLITGTGTFEKPYIVG